MTLQFVSEAAGDASLVVELDIEGVATLLKALEGAMATGRPQTLAQCARSPGAFGNVTFTFLQPRRDRTPEMPAPQPAADCNGAFVLAE